MKPILTFLFALSLLAGVFVQPAPSLASAPASPDVPLLLVVDGTTDDVLLTRTACTGAANDCSLRGAVVRANQNPGSTVQLATMANYQHLDYTMVVSAPMTITTPSAPAAVLTRSGYDHPHFFVESSGVLVLVRVNLTNGSGTHGGAIANYGSATLISSEVYSNGVTGLGGGLVTWENSTLTLIDSRVYRNSAGGSGGGIAGYGGRITLSNTLVYSNVSAGSGGGIGSANSFGDVEIGQLSILNSQVLSNTAASSTGGGVSNGGYSAITGTLFRANTAIYGGAIENQPYAYSAMILNGVEITRNTAISLGYGGGIINGMTLTVLGGSVGRNAGAVGGGLYNGGNAVVSGTRFYSNTSTSGAGGIYNNGSITLTDAILQQNLAAFDGGGMTNNANRAALIRTQFISNTGLTGGGGMRAGGSVLMDEVSFFGNIGGAMAQGGVLTGEDVWFQNNTGAAIFSSNPGAVANLDRATFISNTDTYGGAVSGYGAVTLTNGLISGNVGLIGGAINVFDSGRLTLIDSLVMKNRSNPAGPGDATGAIDNGGVLVLHNTRVVSNTVIDGSGGGLFNRATATARIAYSEFAGNVATGISGGGAIANVGAVTMTHSSIVSNTAVDGGGGISNTGSLYVANSTLSANVSTYGGAVRNSNSGRIQLYSVSVVSNAAAIGGGLTGVGAITIAHTILAYNTGLQPDCTGGLASLGYNLIGNSSGCVAFGITTGNQLDVDPKLRPLARNGGPTLNHLPRSDSPVINAGQATCISGLGALTTDQRGMPRPRGAACDIGAVEGSDAPRAYMPATARSSSSAW